MARRRWQKKGYLYRATTARGKNTGPSWFLQYREDSAEIDPKTGKFKRIPITKWIAEASGPGAVNRKQAERIAWNEHLSRLDQMTTKPMSAKTIAEFVKERFEPDVVYRCKPSGRAHYTGMLKNHVLPAVGEIRLRDLRPQGVQDLVRWKLEYRDEKGKGLSVQTVVHIRNTLSAIFRHAKRCQAYAGDSPTEGVRLPTLEHKERRVLTEELLDQVVHWIGRPDPDAKRKKRGPAPDPEKVEWDNAFLGCLVRVLALVGVRIGEAMGLRWKRVNLTGQPIIIDGELVPPYMVAIRENFVRGRYGTLKTKTSRRDIPLTTEAVRVFTKLASLTRFTGPDDPVFAGPKSGKPLDQHNVAARFLRPAGKLAGVPWVGWHTLRHTAGSLQDQAGLSVTERQRILGHSAAAMTLHYTHADMDLVRERMEKIGTPRKPVATAVAVREPEAKERVN